MLRLGLSQLVCWGISYYLIGVFGERMVAGLGWSPALVYGGFSAALVAMGVVSPAVGRTIDRRGGRAVMSAGSLLLALGCLGLGTATSVPVYYLAWLCLGVAMRMTLYDAAFAALARIGGAAARRPISQITLLGGLASTSFWPIGQWLADALGWRGAVLVYAGFALLTLPLHATIPRPVTAATHGTAAKAPARRPAPCRPPATRSSPPARPSSTPASRRT